MSNSIKKAFGWYFRAGFTKKYAHPFQSVQDIHNLVNEFKSKQIKEQKTIKLAKNKLAIEIKNKNISENIFNAWMLAYSLQEEDLIQLEHQNRLVAYLNYMSVLIGIAILLNIITINSSSFIGMMIGNARWLFILSTTILIVCSFLNGIKRMHQCHNIKKRKLYSIFYTIKSPSKWFW